jgi:hypothetical protein
LLVLFDVAAEQFAEALLGEPELADRAGAEGAWGSKTRICD